MEPKRYIFLKRRRATEARLLGLAVSLILIGLPAELERGVAAEPEAPSVPGIRIPARIVAGTPPIGTAGKQSVRPAPAVKIGAYDDRTLQAFATTAYRMTIIRERWRPVVERAAAAGSEEASKARRAEATELAQAIRAQGLSTALYRHIFNAAQKDPAFKSYLLTLVRDVDTSVVD